MQQKNLMAAHDKVNLATTLKGGSPPRCLRLARSGDQPHDVSDIGQSNVARPPETISVRYGTFEVEARSANASSFVRNLYLQCWQTAKRICQMHDVFF